MLLFVLQLLSPPSARSLAVGTAFDRSLVTRPARCRWRSPVPTMNATALAPTFQLLSDAVRDTRDQAAGYLAVTPAWIDVCFGSVTYVLLNAACRQAGVLVFGGDAMVSIAGRLLALCLFVAAQQLVGVPVSQWLRLQGDSQRVDPNPFFQAGAASPLAGVTFAFIFAVPIATCAQLAGLDWLPAPRPFPGGSESALRLLIAPLSEEIFFRAWLFAAFERAGGVSAQAAAVVASATLFGLYEVPLATVFAPEPSFELLLYQLFGGFLALLYQGSGGSLPLVVVTHSTANLIVTGLRAAQVGSVLPF